MASRGPCGRNTLVFLHEIHAKNRLPWWGQIAEDKSRILKTLSLSPLAYVLQFSSACCGMRVHCMDPSRVSVGVAFGLSLSTFGHPCSIQRPISALILSRDPRLFYIMHVCWIETQATFPTLLWLNATHPKYKLGNVPLPAQVLANMEWKLELTNPSLTRGKYYQPFTFQGASPWPLFSFQISQDVGGENHKLDGWTCFLGNLSIIY